MIGLAQRRGQPQTSGYPVHLLDVELAQQNTGAGTTFLRWRKHDRSAMGVAFWQALMASAATPVTMLDDLHAIQQQRIVLNLQTSLLHTLGRQDRDCPNQLAQAEDVYLRPARAMSETARGQR